MTAMTVLAPPSVSADSVPPVSAGCAVVMDADTGELLWSRHPDNPELIASTTKIMTAYLACEAGELERPVTIPAEAVGVEGSSLYLKEGETLTREELLYGTMLQSGNDAALALAIDTAGSEAAFVDRMNVTARQLGLQNTHYAYNNLRQIKRIILKYLNRTFLCQLRYPLNELLTFHRI